MGKVSRTKKSMINARVNLLFTFLSVFISFFSRKIFINSLGEDFVGLTSTLQSLLGFLNLAELGVGTAIGVTLYKPLGSNDRDAVCEIMSVMAYMYRLIGILVFCTGVVFSFFLPWIFSSEKNVDMSVVYFAFYSFLCSSLFTYFFNYKQTLLSADQRNYEVTKYWQTFNVIKLLLQMYFANYYESAYIWIGIELLFGFLFCVLLNVRIRKIYPWFKCSPREGKVFLPRYATVKTYVRQLFIHKIVGFSQTQLTPFLVFSFVSLSTVTYYTNYITVSGKLSLFVNALLGSTEASVGNLVAENSKEGIIQVFKEMMCIRFFISGFFVFMLYELMDSFIGLWLGQQYVMGDTVLILILLNVFISQYRGAVDQFLAAFGLFKDIWAAVVEVVIFLVVALVGGRSYGLNGILLASIISKFLIIGLWKPYFLFSQGFKLSVAKYWFLWGTHVGIIFVSMTLVKLLRNFLPDGNMQTYLGLVGETILYCVLYIPASILLMYLFAPGMKLLVRRMRYV